MGVRSSQSRSPNPTSKDLESWLEKTKGEVCKKQFAIIGKVVARVRKGKQDMTNRVSMYGVEQKQITVMKACVCSARWT